MRSRGIFIFVVLLLGPSSAWPQESPPPGDSLVEVLLQMQAQMRDLQEAVRELREETARYRAEAIQLRSELARDSGLPSKPPLNSTSNAMPEQPGSEKRLAALEEDIQLLNDRVDEQYQTKVESASKYRIKLSGIALFNLFSNRGAVDSIDNPTLAQSATSVLSRQSFASSLRQSIVGLQVFGPQIAGARTSADVQFDFAGGFSSVENGVTFGLVRLRTARLRLQWQNTAIVGGQDSLFFAPLAPSSFASLSSPSLAYAGTLWAWLPQLRFEHQTPLSENSSINFAAGILDGVTGEPPVSEYFRPVQAGESAGQPAYAARIAWSHVLFGRSLTVGGGAFYNRQNWGFHRDVEGWAATSDVTVPIGRWFSISGEFYRGRAIGGLAGATGRSVVFSGDLADPATQVHGLNTLGGWAQLKFAPTAKLEFNGAFGQDNPFAADLREFPSTESYVNSSVARNRGAMVNVIARPRSDLVFSLEYRRLRTFEVQGTSETADHINLSAGVLF